MEERWHFVHKMYLQAQVFYSSLDHFSILLSEHIATIIDAFKYLKDCQMEEKMNLFSAIFENRRMCSYNNKVRTF